MPDSAKEDLSPEVSFDERLKMIASGLWVWSIKNRREYPEVSAGVKDIAKSLLEKVEARKREARRRRK